MQLRWYQQEAIASIYAYFQSKVGNPIVALPTGTGKSVVIGEFIRGVCTYFPGQRIIMLTHVKELIEQNLDKILTLWPMAPAGVYSAGLGRKQTDCPITFAGIASVGRKAAQFGHIDLVLIDECHLVSANEDTLYRRFLDGLREKNPLLKVIGFSATAYRLGLGPLTSGGVFTDICYDMCTMESFNRLVDEGFLSPLIAKQPKTVYNLDHVHSRGGEFIPSELQDAVDVDALTYSACRELVDQGADRKHWLVFSSGINHARHIAEALDSMCIDCCVIHSKMDAEARDEAIAGFLSGKYLCAINNNILTTGFDFPALDLIGVMRPTSSTGLWVQMLGRGTRPAPGKSNCLVLDFAGNTRRLGPINDPVMPKAKGTGGGEAPVKMCEVCQAYNHASARVCVNCGSPFPVYGPKIQDTAATDEVMRRTKDVIDDAPIVEVFPVSSVTYAPHHKVGGQSSMAVSYYCGLRMFKEYICVEHTGYAKRRAAKWWAERSGRQWCPDSVDVALECVTDLRTPASIRVWVNTKYPEILGVVEYVS